MTLSILQAPNALLTRIATKIPSDLSDLKLVQELVSTFAATPNCVGLAMPQVGYLIRAIVVDVTPKRTETYVMLDPVIVKASEEMQLVNDGCMSVKNGNRRGWTKRPKRIAVDWLDVRGKFHSQKFSGFIAAVIHHEIDHLNGILFTSRLVSTTTINRPNPTANIEEYSKLQDGVRLCPYCVGEGHTRNPSDLSKYVCKICNGSGLINENS